MYRFLILFFCLFSVLFTGHALPITVRQDAVPQPTTVTTTNTQNTAVGQMVTTCEITLTPIKDADGNDAVKQVTKCKVAMNGTNNDSSDGAETPASQDGEAATTTTEAETTASESAATTESPSETATTESPEIVTETVTTDTAPATTTAEATSETQEGGAETTTTAEEATTATEEATTTTEEATTTTEEATTTTEEATTTTEEATTATEEASTTTEESPAATTSAVRDNGASSVAISDISSLLDSTATSAEEGGEATTTAEAEGAVATGQAEGQEGQTEGGATASASAAEQNEAEASASAASTFELPGKKLSVLPIGLGVFAGISVIALIVVGLVTYERTKYRKAFRQRKLAEQGAAMGYGGNMTERA